jgi:uncharacterized protein YjbJ (UPF0337 family)
LRSEALGMATTRNRWRGPTFRTQRIYIFKRRQMVDENRIEGAARNLGGNIQDAVSGLAGDAGMQARGKANQAAGRAQNAYGSAADEARDFGQHLADAIRDQPLQAVGIALGAGLLLGWIFRG